MPKDSHYHCMDCTRSFTVRSFIIRNALRTSRKIACPFCKSTSTNKVGMTIRQRPQEPPPEQPPTRPQIEYIKGLGGDPRRIHSRQEAGDYITRLKKLKATGD